jgi:predicted ATPase/DNA-binding CsgD family transcriptional regulator
VRRGKHNLPLQSTPLVGRDQAISSLRQLLLAPEVRMLTLTGVGGCGKTRLALGLAASVVGAFSDGVWLVALAPLVDPLLVPEAIASVLGVRARSDRPMIDTLVSYLDERELLLLLDNCEHLVEACGSIADALLTQCQGVRLLATSRRPLHISGERAWRVPSLGVPGLDSLPSPDEVAQYPAPRLFAERARAVQSDFDVTAGNAAAVAAICDRLEGLPLAIELAAAWVRALGVEQILERLDNAFVLLVGGSQSSPTRHQTMRATMDWSSALLAVAERAVLRRLAVFAGGWTLEAAEAVCAGGDVALDQVLTLLVRLVDASVVQAEARNGRARYRLLEPVRQYAREHLAASGDLDSARRQHTAFFMSVAQQWEIDASGGGPGLQAALNAFEQDQDNLRAALRWCVEQGEAEHGLRLGKAQWTFWLARGLFTEGRAWLSQLVALPAAEEAPTLRAMGLTVSASLAYRQGSYATALGIYREVLPLLRQANDSWMLQHALADVGYLSLQQGDYRDARASFDEALAVAAAAGPNPDQALQLDNLGWLALVQADFPAARALSEQALSLARGCGDSWTAGYALVNLGYVALHDGELVSARRLLEEGAALQRQIGERVVLAHCLEALGQVATAQGQHQEARASLSECLRLRQDMGDPAGIADTLESIAALNAADMQPELGVVLAGAAAALRDGLGAAPTPMGQAALEQWLVPLRKTLGEDAIQHAWNAGRVMPIDRAVNLALAPSAAAKARRTRADPAPGEPDMVLTAREREVATLLAHGLTNRQIADRLVITERTVGAHIGHILDKLGFHSRHQIAVWASQHDLLD